MAFWQGKELPILRHSHTLPLTATCILWVSIDGTTRTEHKGAFSWVMRCNYCLQTSHSSIIKLSAQSCRQQTWTSATGSDDKSLCSFELLWWLFVVTDYVVYYFELLFSLSQAIALLFWHTKVKDCITSHDCHHVSLLFTLLPIWTALYQTRGMYELLWVRLGPWSCHVVLEGFY